MTRGKGGAAHMESMKKPLFITVLPDGTTAIPGRSEFPVDGDALHPGGVLKQRAQDLIAGNPEALASARAWLGKPLHSSDPELTPSDAAQLVHRLYPGGAPRFVADRIGLAA